MELQQLNSPLTEFGTMCNTRAAATKITVSVSEQMSGSGLGLEIFDQFTNHRSSADNHDMSTYNDILSVRLSQSQ